MIKSLLIILVLCVCCSNAVFQRCRSVPVLATIPVCPSGSVVIYGNQCCPAKHYYEVSSLACKGAWKSAGNSGVCPYGQSMFWIIDERYCCDNKDIYDAATASCHAGGVLGAAINGHCATNYFVTKGNMCCWKNYIYCNLVTSKRSLIQFFPESSNKIWFQNYSNN
ncbi:hypothetical protein GCK72_006784 [Caenorhabditis remanei]|uniref:CC domain-containing protein n=1 Tax=Caenorhabditis remanei TaxID=31234 RepID=A0A6A5HJH1_CAERE|nr:hypothetical protein GCK72_006784 [Caenorhabditis remanei]KAF1766826.1 hypothetical protein GCK72_006784 [Caenorhabditis remanei]